MLPGRGELAQRAFPAVVAVLSAGCIGSFLYALTLDSAELVSWFERWGLVPREFLRGAGGQHDTRQVPWATPVSAMFLHGNALHLLGNLVYLWIFGSALESALGRLRFGLFFGACGLAAALAQVASDPTAWSPVVGMSGAVSGLVAGYAISHGRAPLQLRWPAVRVPALGLMLVWVAIALLAGLSAAGGIASWAHLGGFAVGAVLIRPLWGTPPAEAGP